MLIAQTSISAARRLLCLLPAMTAIPPILLLKPSLSSYTLQTCADHACSHVQWLVCVTVYVYDPNFGIAGLGYSAK